MKGIKYFFAAAALIAAVSCSREPKSDTPEEKQFEGRVLVASLQDFDMGTKTTIDGMSPKWKQGDKVLITDGTDDESEDHCRVYILTETEGDPSLVGRITKGGASFEVTVPKSFGTTVYAFYPEKSYKGIDKDGNPIYNIPERQDGTFGNACICIAKAVEDDLLNFKNVVTLLRFSGKDAEISDIKIVSPSTIAGDFVYNYEENSVTVSEGAANGIEAGFPGSDEPSFVAVAPAKSYAGTMFLFNDMEASTRGSLRYDSKRFLGINKIYSMGRATANMLPGAFTLNDAGLQVYFSKGNLRAYVTGGSKLEDFEFADHQYDAVGASGANTALGSASGYFDLFGWSTAKSQYGITYSLHPNDYGTEFVDWGLGYCEFNDIKPTSVWRTLSAREIYYILDERSASEIDGREDSRFAKIKVNSHNGLLLFPDFFEWSEKMGDVPHYINDRSKSWDDVSSYTTNEFEAMEAAGAVFLPVGGNRHGSDIYSEDKSGNYWLSTFSDSIFSKALVFSGDNVYVDVTSEVYKGYSVRLVTEN